jgi:hypothetical protein
VRKLLFFFFIVFCFSFASLSPVFAFSGSGSGTSGDPYQITTCAQLHEIGSNLSAHYLMKNDIDCTGYSFTPIGDTTSQFFVGTLDGGGHKITHLTISSNENSVGIFQEVGSGGLITNIGYESGSVTTGEDSTTVGSFAGIVSNGSITASYSKASLDGSAASFIDPVMGGFFGHGDTATVSDSYYSGSIINGTANPNYTAGIAGYLSGGSISSSYSTGSLTNGQYVGGIAGRLFSSAIISNSFTTMTLLNASTAGAVVGQISSGTLSSVYWNDTSGGFFTCYFGGNTGCARITNNLSYFYTVTNPPMGGWDFVSTWSVANNGTGYPLLNWQSPNPTPTPTATPTPTPTSAPALNTGGGSHTAPTCSASVPSRAPDLFQIDTTSNKAKVYFSPVSDHTDKYYIAFGYTPGDMRFGGELVGNSTGVRSYTINSLSPNSKYYVRIRAGNGCATGGWSNEMKFTTAKKGSVNGNRFYKSFASRIVASIAKFVHF